MGNQGNTSGNNIKDIQQQTNQEANGKPGTSYAEDTQKNINKAEQDKEQNIGTLENNEQSGSEQNNDKESSLDADERSGGSVL